MKNIIFALPFIVLLAFTCNPKSASEDSPSTSNTETTLPPAETAAVVEDTRTDTPAPDDPATDYETVARQVNDNFPMDQRVAFSATRLAPLCTNKYGCLEEKIYPIGWSLDGKFAYLLEEANEAVMNLKLHFIIQDTETDEQLVKDTYNAMDQPDFREEKGKYTVQKIWTAQQEKYNRWITEHQISAGNGTSFISLTDSPKADTYTFTADNKTSRNEMFDLDFVTQHRLIATPAGAAAKTILNHTFGKYDFALATKALGYFQSPFEARIAVVDAFEKRGYEGPPNVLKLIVVGCVGAR